MCGDGRICPETTVCDPTHGLCVEPDQLTACAGKAETDPCTAGSITGNCTGGVCLKPVCGNKVVEFGELCDDGNNADNDGCSADCQSDESCGNGIIDSVKGEQCDDGNHIDHDGCSSTCAIETPAWIQSTVSPPQRDFAMAAYDSRRDRVVMFGGAGISNGVPLSDTWEWTGADWLQIPTSVAPVGRALHGMAYDAAHSQTVLYGGSIGLLTLGDTWVWDGAWHSVDVPGPPARAAMVMAYDPHRQRVVMFGGQAVGPTSSPVLADTWEFDGSAWTQITTAHSPPPRFFGVMAYDPKRGALVLASGTAATTPITDTWTYDGTDWTNLNVTGTVPAVLNSTMAYDAVGQRILMFGGTVSNTEVATMWALTGSTWTTLSGTAPPARSYHIFAGSSSRLITFGGRASNVLVAPQTWAFTTGWSQVMDPGTLDSFSVVNDLGHATAVIFDGIGARNPITRSGSTWTLSQTGFANRAGAPPTARSNACVAYDYAHHNIVLFGGDTGPNNGIANNETWIWDGAGWSQRTPATSPSVRGHAVCAFNGHGVTVFGGADSSGGATLKDAWTWDGTTWTAAAPVPAGLAARTDSIAAYDLVRKQFVMFGGFDTQANTLYADTWTYDGTTWQQVGMNFHPSGRYGSTLTWNAARKRLLLVGGLNGAGGSIDSYEWDGTAWHDASAANPPPMRFDHGAYTALDGGGVVIYGGLNPLLSSTQTPLSDRWELSWQAAHVSEKCNATDTDGDGLASCADPDCWWICTPLCPPGTTCDPALTKCGDGICDGGREDCRTCPADCTCGAVCGDNICDPGETNCPGDCP